jgi:hypothetical protein
MEVHGYARTTLGRMRFAFGTDGCRVLITGVGEGAIGDLRVDGDDARHAGYERHAVDAEYAC